MHLWVSLHLRPPQVDSKQVPIYSFECNGSCGEAIANSIATTVARGKGLASLRIDWVATA